MSLIFERGGKESTSPTTSSTKEHTLFSYPGNYCTADNPNFDVGGHFTFKDMQDKLIFSICGGDPFNGTPPKNVSKDDLLHSYVITIRGSGSITLQISHQPGAITDPLEVEAMGLPLNKMIGIRVIGIYVDSQNRRNLYVLKDESGKGRKWIVVAMFYDRGQYIPLVVQRIKGMLKSGPPYNFYPYGDDNAITDIHIYGSVEASDTWCRQVNIKKQLINVDGLTQK